MRLIRLVPLALTLLLSACVAGGQGGDGDKPSPLTGGTVTVTSLDAPAAGTPTATEAPATTTPAGSQPQPATPPALTANPEAATAAQEATEETPPENAPPKSEAQLACEADGGTWGRAGMSLAQTCFRPTRDGGKSCRKESDCSTLCLARSRTCAPVTPLFGCHPILQADGREVNLCLD